MVREISSSISLRRRIVILFCLVFAGEMIFSLPFHVARFFRPTFLSAFELSNTQLGDVFAAYGAMAMLAYFPGGLVADRFSPRRLMVLSLVSTALGGWYLAQFPSAIRLQWLFGYWGLTTILLFWAAMIKATRELGGERLQGRAFGVLDGGRGLVAAGVATLAVLLMGSLFPDDPAVLTFEERRHAMRQVIYFYSAGTLVAAAMVWVLIPERQEMAVRQVSSRARASFKPLLQSASFYRIALVVVCAYCGFKGVDNYALYAVEVLGMSEIDAASLTSNMAYVRPVAAVVAGVLADRFSASRIIALGFALMLIAYLFQAVTTPVQIGVTLMVVNLVISICGVFAVRAIYFALLQEHRFANQVTGTAVGLISVLGFTPDVFFAPLTGRILDASPGLEGHQHFFVLMMIFSIVGLLSALFLTRDTRR